MPWSFSSSANLGGSGQAGMTLIALLSATSGATMTVHRTLRDISNYFAEGNGLYILNTGPIMPDNVGAKPQDGQGEWRIRARAAGGDGRYAGNAACPTTARPRLAGWPRVRARWPRVAPCRPKARPFGRVGQGYLPHQRCARGRTGGVCQRGRPEEAPSGL
jgi:hypothetical protein